MPDSSIAITSKANKTFKKLFAMRSSQGIEKYGEFLVGGEKIIRELLEESPSKIACLIVPSDFQNKGDINLAEKIASNTIPKIILSPSLFNEINVFGTKPPLACMKSWAFASFEEALASYRQGCFVFAPLADPENLGAVIRSAAGIGAKGVVIFQETASPFLPRAVRSSAGALWKIPIFKAGSLKNFVPPANFKLYVLDMEGKSILDFKPKIGETFGILCGREGQGVPEHILKNSEVIKIPIRQDIESLNAAVATSIALWEFRNFV